MNDPSVHFGLGFQEGKPRFVPTWQGTPIPGVVTWAQYFTGAFRHGEVVVGVARERPWEDVISNLLLLAVEAERGWVVDALELYWPVDIGEDETLPVPGSTPRWSFYFGHYYILELLDAPRVDLLTWALGFFRGTERIVDIVRKRRLIVRRDHAREDQALARQELEKRGAQR